MKNITDKIAVVTGAGSGIGRALAHELAKQQARLALVDWQAENLQGTIDQLPEGTQVLQRSFDVSDRQAVYDFAQDVVDHYGAVDIVINNAGMTLETKRMGAIDYEDFAKVIDVNLWGVIYGSRAYLPYLETRPEAALVNISSIFGIVAQPLQGPYVASKFAVRGFTETLRNELTKSPVRITCVHPGGIKTNIVRNIKSDKPERLARVAKSFDKVAKTTPEVAAQQIVRAIQRKQKRLLIGRDARILDTIARLFPSRYHEYIFRRYDMDKFSME